MDFRLRGNDKGNMSEDNKKDTTHEDVKKLIEQNISLTKKVLKLSERNHTILKWQYFFGFLKIILIVIPIALGLIYLPPFMEKIFSVYQDFLGFRMENLCI